MLKANNTALLWIERKGTLLLNSCLGGAEEAVGFQLQSADSADPNARTIRIV